MARSHFTGILFCMSVFEHDIRKVRCSFCTKNNAPWRSGLVIREFCTKSSLKVYMALRRTRETRYT